VIKALVVDDSALVRKLFRAVLAREPDFEVEFARNWLEALELLDTFAPDVITLDVNMPQMGGLECLDQIMLRKPCPVVMVSSVTAEGAEETLEALRLGAVDFDVVRRVREVEARRAEYFDVVIAAGRHVDRVGEPLA